MSFREPLAIRASFGRLVVQQLGVARGTAAFGHGAYREDPVIGTDAHPQAVPRVELLRRLGAAAVDLDFTAGDGGRGQRASFEESRGPEPAIETHGCRLSVER